MIFGSNILPLLFSELWDIKIGMHITTFLNFYHFLLANLVIGTLVGIKI